MELIIKLDEQSLLYNAFAEQIKLNFGWVQELRLFRKNKL